MAKIALAVHGGAGTILRSSMTAELEAEYRSGLERALAIGRDILLRGGSSLDAVTQTVCSLEDFHLFNAGRGAVFTGEGKNELDAAIMDGKTLRAGAVAFVTNIKNPVRLARLVMERTEHVLLAGDGASEFADQMGVERLDDAYFYTEHRWQQLQEAMAAGRVHLDHAAKPMGTVGAVACDINGDLAAATSTGGMTNKKFGRVGDTAIIGAGTYADNATCAVSCTGHGEFFMLGVSAYDVAARMKYKNIPIGQAARETVEHLSQMGGEGGLIAVDALGNVTLPFNSDGMYRGHLAGDGTFNVEIYR